MMSNERYKLHPITAIINFGKGLKELFIPILIIFVPKIFNMSKADHFNFWSDIFPIIILVIPAILYLISGVIKWWTFQYWFENKELRVEYGLFVKKKRYIPFDRIQRLNYREGIFHRIFGLVQVLVETAGNTNGKPEVEFTAITKKAAKQIEIIIQKAKETTEDAELKNEEGSMESIYENNKKIIYKMSPKDLIILATTSNSIGVVLTGIAALFSELLQFDFIVEELQLILKYGIIVTAFIIFFAFLVTWIISVILTFINYYGFTIIEENEQIVVTRGLLERKKIAIPLNRVQAIKIIENPFRQIFGLATVVVENAGGNFEEKDKKTTLIPLISKKQLYKFLGPLFPQFVWDVDFICPTKTGKPFFYRKDFLWMIPLIILCSYFFFPYGLVSIVLPIPIILLRNWQYKTTGIFMNERQIIILFRNINRVTFIAEKKRLQIMQREQNFFQRRKNIASIQVTVMSGLFGATAKAANLNEEDAEMAMRWFERREI